MKRYLAVDIGASSGRHILGSVRDGKIALEEVCRFENSQVRQGGHDCWDIDKLVDSVKKGIDTAMEKAEICSIGVYKGVPVVLPAMHDTGSAYLAVPARDDRAVYLSSGTWSLLGVENDRPITTKAAQLANFTNEGGAWGRYRFLKNIMGLWMIQSIRRELNGVRYVEGKDGGATKAALAKLSDYEQGRQYTFGELSNVARGENSFTTLVDVNDQRFMNPDSMIGEVIAAASERGHAPKTLAELMQCVYKSLAACYADAIRNLSEITGKTYTSLNIVGGGCQDLYLNALTAEATGLEVIAGPVEGTAIGNLIVQMVAGGEFPDLASARKAIVR